MKSTDAPLARRRRRERITARIRRIITVAGGHRTSTIPQQRLEELVDGSTRKAH